jgi:hypothetical protein
MVLLFEFWILNKVEFDGNDETREKRKKRRD